MQTISADEFKKRYGEAVANQLAPVQPTQSSVVSRVKEDINKRGSNIVDAIQGDGKFAGESPVRRGFEATAEAFNAIPVTAYNALPDVAREPLKAVGEKVGGVVNALADKVSDSEKLQKWTVDNPEAAKTLEEILGTASAAGQISGDVLLANQTAKVLQKGADASVGVAKDATEKVGKILSKNSELSSSPDIRSRAMEFISREPDVKTATILQETSASKFDKYVKIAKEAAKDPRKKTPYEIAGEEAQKALVALDKKMSGIGKQKSAIIQKAKTGQIDMSKEVRQTSLKLAKDLKGLDGADKALTLRVINRLKTAKRLHEVDKAIDDIQEIIYADAKNTTLSLGKSTTKKLRGIVEELNGQVKTKAPGSYVGLNIKYSNYIKSRDYLNKILGEKVNGVAVRGGSVVKRFFSPSDAGTKDLFKFINKELGIDLSQDVTLARFVMEMFNDPRGRALLDGIPTSPRGLIEKGIDIVVDKTGVGKKYQDALIEAELGKARNLTK